jgi:hypothetical protein
MDHQSFIFGLMAGITLFGAAVLIAMILLERPRCGPPRYSTFWLSAAGRLRHWFELKWPGRQITEEWLQAEEDHARLREETALRDLEGKRSAAQSRGPSPDRSDKKEPPQHNS